MSTFPPFVNITGVDYSITTSEDAKQQSFVEIANQSQLVAGRPVPDGVYSAKMGTFDYLYNCTTCAENKDKCLAHFGSINLGENHVLMPMFYKYVTKWLRIICINCGSPVFSENEILEIPLSMRFDRLSKKNTAAPKSDKYETKLKACPHCGAERYQIKRAPASTIFELVISKRVGIETEPFTIKQIVSALNKITPYTVKMITGNYDIYNPRKLFTNIIPVLPAPNRPESHNLTGMTKIDDQTMWIKTLVTENTTNVKPDILNTHYYEHINGASALSKTKFTGLKKRIPGKNKGRIRGALLGKRIHGTTRAVIIGDASLKLTELGFPLSETKHQSIPIKCDISNREELLIYFLNGKDKYPGASKLIKPNGAAYDVGEKNIRLEYGDILYRDIIDGDLFIFNRAPSLLPSNAMALRAVVQNHKVFSFHPNLCPEFNADFDGDAMLAITIQNIVSIVESDMVSSTKEFFMSHKDSKPMIGQIQDGIVGLASITKTGVNYDKLHAMRAFGKTTLNPAFDKASYTGRELISMILPPVNFSTKPSMFKDESHLPFTVNNFHKDDFKVEIVEGVHKTGILDKASIGGGVINGLYHIIYSQFGASLTLDVIFNMNQLAIHHLNYDELTVGYGDLIPDNGESIKLFAGEIPNVPEKYQLDIDIEKYCDALRIENDKQIELLDSGNLLAPIGKTVEEYFEELQINILNSINISKLLLASIDTKHNNFYRMISVGSKGSIANLQLMTGIIGLIVINGHLPQLKMGYKRPLACFRQCDLSLEARGFVRTNYRLGVTSSNLYYQAMAERHSIILKSMFTAVIGLEERTSIKNLENIIVNNILQVTNGPMLLQNVYGGDGIDTRKVIEVQIPILLSDDESFEADYGGHGKYSEILKQDREYIRKHFIKLNQLGNSAVLSGKIMAPFDVKHIWQRYKGATGGYDKKYNKIYKRSHYGTAKAGEAFHMFHVKPIQTHPFMQLFLEQRLRQFPGALF